MDLITKTIRKNPGLIKFAGELHQSGQIPPDTYVLDLDMIGQNALNFSKEANRVGLIAHIAQRNLAEIRSQSRRYKKTRNKGSAGVQH